MSHADNMQRDVLVMNLELQLEEKMQKHYGKSLKDGTKEEVYYAVLEATKDLASVMDENDGEKKVYYISAEFLIGKLLSNNLINLGIYEKINGILEKNGHTMAEL